MIPVLIALAIIALLLFVILAGRPDEFTVSRSANISASPEQIFPHVNELKQWEPWSPWAKIDPNCKITFEGSAAGTGASYAWSGNKKVGAGKMTIIESVPDSLICLRLEFLKPFKATNLAEFKFTPQSGPTLVVWSMSGKNNLFFKVFGLFMDCDKMIGKDFEKGLASLKSIAEAPTQ